MNRSASLLTAFVALLALAADSAAAATPVPAALQDWQGWVLKDREYLRCPFIATASADDQAAHRCAWPDTLALNLDSRGGTFSQRWKVYSDSWIVLPGSFEHWPRDVRVDGVAAAVVARAGVPQLRVVAGEHAISGHLAWSTRPESLPVATQTAIVELTLDGRRIEQPERPRGELWLGQRRLAAEPQQLQIQVYRLVQDDIPVRLVTRLRLQVSGDGREELLSKVLPAGFVPLSLEGNLPARLEADGRLRVQLRPGSFDLTLQARGPGVAAVIARPAVSGTWAQEEVWSFEGNDRLRVAAAEGAEGIDPAQANVPGEWRGFPAFRMGDTASLSIVERSRGLANLDDNALELRREMWLDFDHEGYTAVDTISGALHRDWRLDMASPFHLESAHSEGNTLLVTAGEAEGSTGVELRSPDVSLEGVSRLASTRGRLPATGWSTRFDAVSGLLHLPPGHRLLGVLGADDAPQSWVSGWGLWNLFGVLVVVVFTYWIAGMLPAAVAAAALLLMYQESPQLIWLWANLLAAVALARAAPDGRLRRYASGYRTISFVVLGLALLPLLIGQLRLAFYPQLDARNPYVNAPAMQMPAPPPPAEEAPSPTQITRADAGEAKRFELAEAVIVTGARASASVTQRYATGTVLQAGPGKPDWRYRDYNYTWSGPVEAAQAVRFIYIGPVLLGLWRVAGVLLLVGLLLSLARASFASGSRPRAAQRPPQAAAAAVAALFCAALLAGASPAVQAQATPDAGLLAELRARLTERPACTPTCAEVMRAQVVATAGRLEVELEISALTQVAVALPQASDRWQLQSVTVDGRPAVAVGRENDGSLWLPVDAGAHRVRLSGPLATADSIQVSFPQTPRVIAVSATGWDTAGVSGDRLVSGSLELVRRARAGDDRNAAVAASEFPAFVRVTRAFDLDLDWTAVTSIERVAPQTAAVSLEIPLVKGESVLTPGIEVRESSRVFVGLARGQERLSWRSALARSDALELSVPQDAARSEVWTFKVSPQWHVGFAGVPAVLPEEDGGATWIYHYYPRAGETLKVTVTRPAATAGQTLAIDAVNHQSDVGKRSTTNRLVIDYRSTQGGRHVLALPESARVTAFSMDGVTVPLRPDKGELPLSLLPGAHQIELAWIEARGVGVAVRPDKLDLRSPASNIATTISLPQDRWPLYVYGGGVGPALVYWGELIVFLAIAWGLGRLSFSPLRSWEWLLLGLGLSTLSWFVFLGMIVWLLAMRWRRDWNARAVARWPFNVVQLLLALLSVVAVASLVFSGIRYGLLAAPDMGVVGPGSGGTIFRWFADRSESLLPQPIVVSLPLWVYKTLMFAWALWIALALARWLRFAWDAWSRNGLWRGKPAPT